MQDLLRSLGQQGIFVWGIVRTCISLEPRSASHAGLAKIITQAPEVLCSQWGTMPHKEPIQSLGYQYGRTFSVFLDSVVLPRCWNPANGCSGARIPPFLSFQFHQGVSRVPRLSEKKPWWFMQNSQEIRCLFPQQGIIVLVRYTHTPRSGSNRTKKDVTERLLWLTRGGPINGALLFAFKVAF